MRRPAAIVFALALACPVPGQERVRPRVGLVLGGGGARGAAHVGVIQVLEEMRVPVDFVVGTSIGSIVGALYAAGYSPAEMADIIDSAEWDRILSDDPPRDELWFRRRQDNRRFQVDFELGWRDGPALPPGLILGRNTEAFLEQLTLPIASVTDFDDLTIPFRCVATDVKDGSAVVFRSGSLTRAIRASMSLPGVFAPMHIDGRWLVDGGVVDNVPVDVAREAGAEILIVVDVSTPLADPAGLRSLLAVSDQVVGILMQENRKRALEAIGPDDLLLTPELGDLGTMDFARSKEAIGIGRVVAEAARERLGSLAVDEETWRAWVATHRSPTFHPLTVRTLQVENRSRFSDDVIRAFSAIHDGAPLDPTALEDTRERLAGLGVFERIEIDVTPAEDAPGEADVTVRPIEKDWGPHYLRFGLAASSNLQGSGDFGFGVQHTWTPANPLGGEWRNEVEIGTRTRLFSEFYQPVDAGLRWFVAPEVEFEQWSQPLIIDRQKIAGLNVETLRAGLFGGRNLGSWGEVRVGYEWVTGKIRPDVVLPGLLPSSVDIDRGQFAARLLADTLDDVKFPRDGFLGFADWEYGLESLGADADRSVVFAGVAKPLSFGELTLTPSIEAGSKVEGEEDALGPFTLGGFQRLSGLGRDELSGSHYGLGVLRAYYRLSQRQTRFSSSLYVGGSAEVGGIWPTRDEIDARDLIFAGTVYVAADTVLGAVHLGGGFAEEGNRAFYVFVGPTF